MSDDGIHPAQSGPTGIDSWAIVESSPDGHIVVDNAGVIVAVNSQVEVLFGYDRAELIGQAIELLVPLAFRDDHTAQRAGYAAEPQVRAMGSGSTLWGRRRDGTEFPAEIALSPLRALDAKDSTVFGVVASIRDVTERHEAEAYTALVRSTIDATHDAVYIIDPDSFQFTYANAGASAQTGYTAAELAEMSPIDITTDFTADSFSDLIAPLVDGRISRFTFVTSHRHKAGHEVPTEVLLEYPPEHHPGAGRSFIAIVRDQTETVRRDEVIAASESAFRTAFEAGPVAMFTASIDAEGNGVVERVNAALCNLLNRDVDELVGATVGSLVHAEDRALYAATARPGVYGRDRTSLEHRFVRRDGAPIWVSSHSTVLPHSGPEQMVLTHVLDIGERRAAEIERDRVRRWQAGLSEIRAHLLASDPTAEVFETICRHAVEIAEADVGTIVRRDAQDLRFEAALGVDVADLEARGDDFAVLLDATWSNDRPTRALPELEAGWTTIALPMAYDREAEAMLMLARRPGGATFDEALPGIEIFVDQAVTALDAAQARRDRQRVALLSERERIARDLHDVVIQRIFAAGLGLQAITPEISDETTAAKVAGTVAELDTAITELRSAIFGLSILDSPRPLRDRVEELVHRHTRTLGFRPSLAFSGDVEAMPQQVVEQMLVSLNEALTNVARHARASAAEVGIDAGSEQLTMSVVDDGRGFDPTHLSSPAWRGEGFSNMVERARHLGGECSLENRKPEGGARMLFVVPATWVQERDTRS